MPDGLKIMVIGDPHAKPGVSNRRFTWLGRMARDRKPDIIIDIGDWNDMESLCSYDKGKQCYEGRRYIHDIEAGREARKLFDAEYKRNKKGYKPVLHSLGGNHDEGRISKTLEMEPELRGAIGFHDLAREEFGWQVTPFKQVLQIERVSFCHFFASGVMGRPMGGEHPAATMIKKLFVSAIAGHSHLLAFSTRTNGFGEKLCAAQVGCYMDPDQYEDYAGPQVNEMWRSGIAMLNNVQGSSFDFEWVDIERIAEKYGD